MGYAIQSSESGTKNTSKRELSEESCFQQQCQGWHYEKILAAVPGRQCNSFQSQQVSRK